MSPIKNMIQMSVLFLAWIALFYILTFFTQLTFVPWDGAIDWPAVGTWQRTLNDFFASDPRRLVISVPVVVVSMYFTFTTLRRHPDAINQLIRLHYLFIPVLFLAWWISVFLNNWLHPYPPVMYDPNYRGFHLSIIPGITLIGLCLTWFRQQARAAHPSTLTAHKG